MSTGACCPGKSTTKRITIGGQQIGVSFLDQIIGKAMASPNAPEEELRFVLLKELKIYNYVPASAEGEYTDAIWEEFVKERARRSKLG